MNDVKSLIEDVIKAIKLELKEGKYSDAVKDKVSDIVSKVKDYTSGYSSEEIFAKQDNDRLLLTIALPGVNKEDIEISEDSEESTLLININNNDDSIKDFWSVKKTNLYYDFSDENVDIDNLSSEFSNGLLKISIPLAYSKPSEKRKFNIN